MDDDFEPTQHFCCVVCSLVSLGFDGGPGEEDLLPMSSLELSNFEESGTAGGASFLEGRVGAPFVVAGSALSRRPWLNFRTGLVSHFLRGLSAVGASLRAIYSGRLLAARPP